MQGFLAGKLEVHAEPISQMPKLIDKFGRRAGDGFGMDVAAEAVLFAQKLERSDHELGGVVGVANDPRA